VLARFTLTFHILLLTVNAFAQSQIKGIIADSLTTKSVEYAIVSVYKSNDTRPLEGKLTDSTGRFAFADLKQGNYDLKVELMGYQAKTFKNIALKNEETVNIGTIGLFSQVAHLNEIEVKGEQDPNQNKLDKQTYKADQFQSAKGGTAIDYY